jgi:putative alpha-1,2-mannosidase
MSSWFLFSAIGFYPVAGTTTFLVGAPLFDKILVKRTSNKHHFGAININAPENSASNMYVKSYSINNKVQLSFAFDDSILQSQDSTNINFVMNSTP